jgi:diguanylate cyclase (GGDEF)-like protein
MADFHFAGGVQGHFLENVVGWADALEAIRLARSQNEAGPETTSSLRRLARAIEGSVGMYGHPEARRCAAALQRAASTEASEPSSVGDALDNLIAALHDIADGDPDHKICLLVVEPDADTADLLAVMLSTPNRDVAVVATAQEARDALAERDVSLIMLALDLPSGDGRTFLAELRERTRTTAVPVFILSERGGAPAKIECFALGADAFFQKPFDPATLSSAVSVRLQRRASTQSRDPVTGLPDRTTFENAYERVQSTYAEADRDDSFSKEDLYREGASRVRGPLCLAALAPDHLEELADVHGPAAGEEALRHTADLALRSLRDADLMARWDERSFAALLPDTSLEEAAEVLDRAVQTVRQASVTTARGDTLRLSCSAGLSRVNDPAVRPLEEAHGNATHFLQRAQQKGGRRLETEQPVETERAAPGAASTSTLLLVEDDELIATILQDRLEREGFVVEHFANGLRAHEYVQDDSGAALALLDVKLPGMGGFELLERLRAMPAYARRPILMLTAMSQEENVVRGFELGADDYILKPFSPDELVARVRHLLSKNGRY